MGVFKAATDVFFKVCSTLALTVSTLVEWTTYILQLNYRFVTNIYASVCYILDHLFTGLSCILQTAITVILYIFDFLVEIYACFCALLVLVWRICVLVYKVLCVVFSGVEALLSGLWNSGVLTCITLQQCVVQSIEACGSITNYVAVFVQDVLVYFFWSLTTVGTFASAVVRGLWVGIGYIPATVSNLPTYIAEWMSKIWFRCTVWTSFAFMGVTRDTYLGLVICCFLYVIVSKVLPLLQQRDLTFFPLRRRQPSAWPDRDQFAFDRGFESDLDDIDNNNSADENDDTTNEDDSDTQTELTLSDNDSEDDNSAGSESDVSLDSHTFSSEEGDHDIDIQLPTNCDNYSLRSRSSTPSRNTPQNMNHDDFEREIERERDKRKCVVCQDINKSVLLLPCKHMCLCPTCANQIVRTRFADRRSCPLCRTRIETVINVYV